MRHSSLLPCAAALVLLAAAVGGCGVLPAAPADPQPGAVLVGTIAMDGAQSARITLHVADDGQALEQVWVAFSELKCPASAAGAAACARWQWGTWSFTQLNCQGFSAGSLSALVATGVPVSDGTFELQSRFSGEMSGRFTSPTAAQGTVHLALFGGQVECGTWEWQATGE